MSSKLTLTCRFDWEPVSEPDQAAFINHVLRNLQQNCETMHFNRSSGTWWTGHSFSEFPGLIFKKKKITFVVQWIKIRLRRGEDRRSIDEPWNSGVGFEIHRFGCSSLCLLFFRQCHHGPSPLSKFCAEHMNFWDWSGLGLHARGYHFIWSFLPWLPFPN